MAPRKLIIKAAPIADNSGIDDTVNLSATSVAEELSPNTNIADVLLPSVGSWTAALAPGYTAGGRVQLVGTQLRTTNVKFDYESATQHTIRIVATRTTPPYLQITREFSLTVTNVEGDTPPVEINYVASTVKGGASLNDLTVVAPARTVKNNAGADVAVAANVLALTDIGVHTSGSQSTFYARKALRPSIANGWVHYGQVWGNPQLLAAASLASARFPAPAKITGTNAEESKTGPAMLASPPVGSSVVIHAAFIYDDGDPASDVDAILITQWDGGEERWIIRRLRPNQEDPGNPGVVLPLALVNETNGYSGTGINVLPLYAVRDDTGGTKVTEVAFTVPNVPGNNLKVMVRTQGDNKRVAMGYFNVYAGSDLLPLRDTGDGPGAETQAADDHTLAAGTPLANILLQPAGGFGMEVQALAYESMGTVGMGGASVAGNLAKVGTLNLLKPDGPTAFRGPNGASKALGLGGWRGIVRIACLWDASGFSVYANGSKINSGPAVNRSGAIKLMQGITGRIRGLVGWTSKPSNAVVREWTMIWNKDFLRPGTALAPGQCNLTHWNDYDGPDLDCVLRKQSARAPQPVGVNAPWYPDGDVMADSYDVGAALTGEVDFGTTIMIPRYFFHNSSVYGMSKPEDTNLQIINNEPQFYADPVGDGVVKIPSHEVSNSMWRIRIGLTSALSAEQQAVIPAMPAGPDWWNGAKMPYWAGCACSHRHFTQKFGVFASRDKMPAFKGSWPAWWLYWLDHDEIDIEEYYGQNPQETTFTLHVTTVEPQIHLSRNKVLGFNLSQDFHDRTVVWTAGKLRKYFNGELVGEHEPPPGFDENPMFLLYNFAVAPFHQPDATTTAYLQANPNTAIEVDRTSVFQIAG